MKAFETRSPIDFPRKRASIACNFCRHRKRKCDGQKPICGLCRDAGAECVYQESERAQDVPTEILSRLSHLEDLLEQQREAIAKLTAQLAASNISVQPAQPVQPVQHAPLSHASVYSSQLAYNNWDPSPSHKESPSSEHRHDSISTETPSQSATHPYKAPAPLNIVKLDHQTPTGSLFALDHIKSLIGEYPEDFFYLLESKRPFDYFKAPTQTFEQIVPSVVDKATYVGKFFEEVHPFFPIVDEKLVVDLFDTFPSSMTANRSDTSLCLIILALGKLSMNTQRSSADGLVNIETAENLKNLSGIEYFALAYRNLNDGIKLPCQTEYMLPLAFFYASVYLRYMGRPLQAWQLITRASASVKFMISQLHGMSTEDERATLYRTAWGCYLLECDDLAEFQFPRSGIEVVVDTLRFDYPLFPEFANAETNKSREAFLAMCLVRMILDQAQDNTQSISPTLHPNDVATRGQPKRSISPLERVCAELDRQLEEWLDHIPPTIKPPNMKHQYTLLADKYDGYIRARYWATKYIICRPSLVYAAQLTDTTAIPVNIYENCCRCVNSCRQFIFITTGLLLKRTHATWLRLQALLAAILTLSIAKSTPSLAPLVSDFDFDEHILDAISMVTPWAEHLESADVILGMIKTIRQKIRVAGGGL